MKNTYSNTHRIQYGTGERIVEVHQNEQAPFFKDLYYRLLSMKWSRFLFFISLCYLLINLIFGTIYFINGPEGLSGQHPTDHFSFFIQCFFFSVQTFSTIGYGAIAPQSVLTNIVVSIQALIGMLSIGVISGLFFSRFTRPTAKIIFSKNILKTQHLGKNSLVFRLANQRINVIVNAKVHATFLYNVITPEGNSMRRLTDLKLNRDFNAIFFLNWMVSHNMDENSPLFGLSLKDLEDMKAEVMVTFSGTDQTFGQTIHTSTVYPVSNFIENKSFEDMLIRTEDDFSIHLHKISDLKD